MTQHTAEPWDLMPHGIIYGGPVQQCANGSTKSQIAMTIGADFMAPGEQQANARRIVACVNICAGISTEDLEQHSDIVSAQLATEHAQETLRDELAAALTKVTSDLFYQIEARHGPKTAAEYPSIAEAKALIAKLSA